MKAIKLLSLFLLSCLLGYTQYTPKPYVDERIELLSTIFRLAEAREYLNNDYVSYVNKVDSFFAPVKHHDIVKYVIPLRENHGVSYDAVMRYAINIEITPTGIQFKKNRLSNIIEERWTNEDADKFLILLNQFYTDSKFHHFFEQQQPIRDSAASRFTKTLGNLNFSWFGSFYGQDPKEDFRLVISLLNGGGNYGPSLEYSDKTQELYAIIGTWQSDSLGFPKYSEESVSDIIIHEYNHSFCNPLMIANYDAMKPVAKKFFNLNKEKMLKQAYGDAQTMLCEILVRASVIQYAKHIGVSKRKVQYLITSEQGCGFTWIDQLCNLLDTYEANRTQYSTLTDFMPEIVKLQNSLSPKKIQKELGKKFGKIKSFSIKNHSTNVDPNTLTLVITFAQPMYTGANGTSYGRRGGLEYMPQVKNAYWNEKTQKEWVLDITLEPNKEYSISFPAQFFVTADFYPLAETYYLDFKTGKQK